MAREPLQTQSECSWRDNDPADATKMTHEEPGTPGAHLCWTTEGASACVGELDDVDWDFPERPTTVPVPTSDVDRAPGSLLRDAWLVRTPALVIVAACVLLLLILKEVL